MNQIIEVEKFENELLKIKERKFVINDLTYINDNDGKKWEDNGRPYILILMETLIINEKSHQAIAECGYGHMILWIPNDLSIYSGKNFCSDGYISVIDKEYYSTSTYFNISPEVIIDKKIEFYKSDYCDEFHYRRNVVTWYEKR